MLNIFKQVLSNFINDYKKLVYKTDSNLIRHCLLKLLLLQKRFKVLSAIFSDRTLDVDSKIKELSFGQIFEKYLSEDLLSKNFINFTKSLLLVITINEGKINSKFSKHINFIRMIRKMSDGQNTKFFKEFSNFYLESIGTLLTNFDDKISEFDDLNNIIYKESLPLILKVKSVKTIIKIRNGSEKIRTKSDLILIDKYLLCNHIVVFFINSNLIELLNKFSNSLTDLELIYDYKNKHDEQFLFSVVLMHLYSLLDTTNIQIASKPIKNKEYFLINYSICVELMNFAKIKNMPLLKLPKRITKEQYGIFLKGKQFNINHSIEVIDLGTDCQKHINGLNSLSSQIFNVNKYVLNDLLSKFNFYLGHYLGCENMAFNFNAYLFQYLENDNKMLEILLKADVFFNIISTVVLYSYLDVFYFPIFLDYRGRIYYKSWPLNPQGCKMSRALLNLQFSPRLFLNHEDSEMIFFDLWKKTIKQKDYFSILQYTNLNEILIGLDASASSFSIISALIGDQIGLELTNVLDTVNDNSKKDYYYLVLLEWLKVYPKFFVNKKETKDNILIGNKILSNMLIFFDRKSIKGIVMRLFYSEGDNSRIKLFYEFYELNFKIDEIEITEVLKKKVMSFLNKSFMSFFCSFCPKYFELKKFFDDIFITENIEKNKGIIYSSGNNFIKIKKVYLNHYNTKRIWLKKPFKIALNMKSNFSQSKNSFYLSNNISFLFNSEMYKSEIMASFIHYLDSKILLDVVSNKFFINESKFVVHDCIYTNYQNSNLIKKLYFDSFINILLKKDPLTELFKSNGLDLNISKYKKYEVYLNTLTKDKNKIIEKLDNNILIKGKFILS